MRSVGGRPPRIVQRGIWSKDLDALDRWDAPMWAGVMPDRENLRDLEPILGLRSVRFRGLAGEVSQVRLTAIAFNLKRANCLLLTEAA